MIIAIDGPAASGKGTLARRLASHFSLRHLDTGLTYRAAAAAILKQGVSLEDEAAATDVASKVDFAALDRAALSLHEIGEAASKIAVMPSVRRVLVEGQRRFAKTSPGAVLDGRDIGTIVCPDADVKLYVTASPQVRARRRTDELNSSGITADRDAIHADLVRRDERDSTRSDSPLRPADDAHLLDTSKMDIETAVRKAVGIVDSL
ncbi:(d)CMP kinase [Breoghania sp.]|uniref:(d)CMP kinase n=1 Tax=Breoghania sp. TaxID=2065378 RepID=UPI00262B0354|nr:(d)CMP kinase [Breoghania sp.]MDJ0931014.1 (d)CMP kinase [Breoghania sp.]